MAKEFALDSTDKVEIPPLEVPLKTTSPVPDFTVPPMAELLLWVSVPLLLMVPEFVI